jgi:hypothetical protein
MRNMWKWSIKHPPKSDTSVTKLIKVSLGGSSLLSENHTTNSDSFPTRKFVQVGGVMSLLDLQP